MAINKHFFHLLIRICRFLILSSANFILKVNSTICMHEVACMHRKGGKKLITKHDKNNLIMFILVLISLTIIFSFGTGSVSAASGSTIYVNGSYGNDEWDGQSLIYNGTSGPKKSIKSAVGTLKANGTIFIANGLYTGVNNTNISIDKSMTIKGQSQTGTVINGTGTNWIFYIYHGNITITNLTFTNGTASEGGAIFNLDNLTVINCTFTGNKASYGSTIENRGTLNIKNSIFANNIADYGTIFNKNTCSITDSTFTNNNATNYGGAILNYGALVLKSDTFIGNQASYGGVIDNDEGNLTVISSTFTNNNATNYGGAILNEGILTLTGSTFTSNKGNYGGAIDNENNLTIACSTFTNNSATHYGGAILNEDTLTVAGSTFSGNNAGIGGAVYNHDTLAVENSTFTNNIANTNGGAIQNENTCNITGSAFTGNRAANYGGALDNNVGNLIIISSDFTGNGAQSGGAISNYGPANIHFSRIFGNTASQGGAIYSTSGPVNAEINWWGSNTGPSGSNYGVIVSKWLVLTAKAAASSVQTNTHSIINADLRYDNTGILHTEAYLPNGILVSFTTSLGTISSQAITVNGIAQSTLKSSKLGSASVSSKLDNQISKTSIKIIDTVPPKVTSTYPKKNAKKISRTKKITIKFSEKIKKSINWSKIYVKNKYGKKVKITKKWISSNYLYIKIKKRSSYSSYTVYIPSKAVQDYAGNKLAKKYTFKFKTGK